MPAIRLPLPALCPLITSVALLPPGQDVARLPAPLTLAALDRRVSASPGETFPLPSRFEGQPLVEPHLSAHPGRDGHLLVAAMVVTDIQRPYESCRLSSFVSRDGGETWKETAHDWWGYDPWTAIGPDGTATMTWLGTRGGFEHRFPVRFFRSPDGGREWAPGVQTREGSHDGTKLASAGEDVYFTTVHFGEVGGADVVLERSLRGGPFEPAARIEGAGQRLNFCEPAVLADGSVLIPASRYLESVWVQRFDPNSGEQGPRRVISSRPGGARGYMRLAADRSGASRYRDHVYLVRALGDGASALGVCLTVSRDGGRSWGPDLRVDLFEDARPSHAQAASLALSAEGLVGVSWVDCQDDPEGEWTDVYFALSRDGGESFQRPVRVTTVSTDPATEANGPVASHFPGGGHYLGLAARAGGSFQLVWSDSRNGPFELQTATVEIQQ